MFNRYFALLAGLVIAPTLLSALAFAVSPQSFYYRAWEYHEEIGYRFAGAALDWHGEETGDLSRDSLLFRQTSRDIELTTTPDGYRATPAAYGPPRILILGDSLSFGSGLSDAETVAWRLAERLQVGVFNGARRGGLCLLDWPELASVELVIEIHTERFVTPEEVVRRTSCARDGRLRRASAPLWMASVPAHRYLAPAKLARAGKALARDLWALVRGKPASSLAAPLLHGIPVDDDQLSGAVAEASAVRDRIAERRLGYLFLAVPSSRTIYGSWGPEAGMNGFHRRLASKLAAVGIDSLDLEPPMRAAADGPRLFQPYDTHWSPAGSDLVANLIASHLEARGWRRSARTASLVP